MGNSSNKPNLLESNQWQSPLEGVQKADNLIALADKKYNSRSWLTPNEIAYEEAAELYIQAANIYRSKDKFEAAAITYVKAGLAYDKQQLSQYEVSKNFASAADAYSKVDILKTIYYYDRATEIAVENGKFGEAAEYQERIATIHENADDIVQSIVSYRKALNYHDNAKRSHKRKNCLLKIATLSRKLRDYNGAAETYSNIVESYLSETLTKYYNNGYLFQAMICLLCTGDLILVNRHLDQYKKLCSTFETSNEYTIIINMVNAIDNMDLGSFDDIINQQRYKFKEVEDLLPIIRSQFNNVL
ncbi:Soluble NSF attachment protein (SNAP) [uncultured virus]|nr:Soluble NSF attachment protein (SNAP) [uncultured virus]